MKNSKSLSKNLLTLLMSLSVVAPWTNLTGHGGSVKVGSASTGCATSATDGASRLTLTEAAAGTRARVSETYGGLPLSFEMNEGQADRRVGFISRTGGQALFLTPTEAVLKLDAGARASFPEGRVRSLDTDAPLLSREAQTAGSKLSVLRMKLVGANASAKVTGLDELPGKSNYFIGNDPKKWRVNVPNFARVKYEQVYPGVNLVYYGNQGHLEYDLIVAPGADPKRIKLAFEGADNVRIDESGDLVLRTAASEFRQRKPAGYQEVNGAREHILARFVKKGGNEIAFELGRYDASKPVVIDPVLFYSTYLGGSTSDAGNDIAVDSAGNAYVTGNTFSLDFPTANALQPNRGNPSSCCSTDAFVTKLNATGTALVYSTYLGGSGSEQGNGVAVDSFGNPYVTGTTDSADFPTANALQPIHTGGLLQDAFVAKLNPAGSAFVYSTYLGGGGSEGGWAIASDLSGNAYVTGSTGSPDFPTANPLQPHINGIFSDIFITAINSTGTSLIYSTYLGGTGLETGFGIAVDAAGSAYVTGSTTSVDFPLMNALQSEFTDQTVFKSADRAGDWTGINNGVPPSLFLTAIAIDPTAPNTLYIGTNNGIFKSTNAGGSWSPMNNGLVSRIINHLQVNPMAPSTIYGANGSIIKSTDGGTSWSSVLNVGGLRVVAVDPTSPSTVYSVRSQQIFKSTDGGSNWQSITVRDFPFGPFATSLQCVAVDPTTPSTLYVGDVGHGVFKSTNGGTTWRNTFGIFFGVSGIAVDPVTSSTVYEWSPSSGLGKSTNGGLSFTSADNGLNTSVRSVVIDPSVTSRLYAATDRGVYKSTNGGATWNAPANKLADDPIRALAVDPVNTSTLYAGIDPTPDCFVAKLNPSGSQLLYSTFLGGDTRDNGEDIAVDSFGNAYVAGFTLSSDFPTMNSMQPFGGGFGDAFVTKLDPTGSQLVYSTYLGGSGSDSAQGIAVDSAGNVYVAGSTVSADFPVVAPVQASQADSEGDPFVSKLNAAGSALLFSTYLGGAVGGPNSGGLDYALSIAIDPGGSAYVTGLTLSNNFPVTPGAFQTAKHSAGSAAFIAKISALDVCLQDEANGTLLQFSSVSGDYVFDDCRKGTRITGRGVIKITGCKIELQDRGADPKRPDRDVYALANSCSHNGSASVRILSMGKTFTITDTNTTNNACLCVR